MPGDISSGLPVVSFGRPKNTENNKAVRFETLKGFKGLDCFYDLPSIFPSFGTSRDGSFHKGVRTARRGTSGGHEEAEDGRWERRPRNPPRPSKPRGTWVLLELGGKDEGFQAFQFFLGSVGFVVLVFYLVLRFSSLIMTVIILSILRDHYFFFFF